MKSRRIPLACLAGAAAALASPLAGAETLSNRDATKVFGLMNFKTGAFTPMPRATTGEATPAAADYTGLIVINITAANKSQIPADTNLNCEVSWWALDNVDFISWTRSYSSLAQVTPTTINCVLKVPYLVSPNNPARTTITLDPSMSAFGTGVAGTSKPTVGIVYLPAVSFPLPASGTVTTKSFSTVY